MTESCNIIIEEGRGWRCLSSAQAEVWLKGDIADGDVVKAFEVLGENADVAAVRGVLAGLNGHFAMIVRHPNWVCAAVDRVRTIPLSWAHDEASGLSVAQQGRKLVAALPRGENTVDMDQALAVALAGYTIGDATLYKGIETLLPGCFLFCKGAQVVTQRYHHFEPWTARQDIDDDCLTSAPMEQTSRIA